MGDVAPSSEDLQARLARAEAELSDLRQLAHRADDWQRAAAALDTVSEGFVILDHDWRFVFVNQAAERFVQKSRAELLGRDHWALFPEASGRRFGAEYRRAVTEKIPVHFEEFYPEPLNKWYEVRAYPSAEGLSIFFRDVTERHRIEEALRHSEERYRSLFNSMTEGFAVHEIVCDDHGVPCDYRFLEINPAFERLTGLKRQDVVGRLMSEVLPTDDPHWVRTYGAVALMGESTHFDHYSPALGRHYDVFAYQPAPRQFAVLFHDITERKQLEEDLRVNLTKYSVLFDSFPLGISVTDPEGNLREANRAAVRLLGLSEEEHARRQIDSQEWRIIRPDGSPMPAGEFASVRALKEQRLVKDVEMGIVHPGGDVTWISVSAAPLPLEDYGVVITYGDISARRRAEAELEEAKRLLDALMEFVPDGITIADAPGVRIRRVSRYGEMLAGGPHDGMTASEVAGTWRVYHADGVTPMADEDLPLTRAQRTGEAVSNVEMVQINARGERVELQCNAAPIRDRHGAIVGSIVVWRDIAERNRITRELEQARAEAVTEKTRLEAVMDALPTGVAILDARGGNIRSNAAFERIWGAGRPATRDVAGYAAYKAWWVDTGREVEPEEWASARAVQHGETVTGQVMEIQRFDGGRAYILNSAAPILDAKGQIVGCAVVVQDITRRIEVEHALAQSEAALRRVNDELEAANEALRCNNATLETRVAERTADLAQRTTQLQALARDLTRAEERERQRVAQVIHDHLQQLLSVARINLGVALAQTRTRARAIQKSLTEVDGLIAESLDITRSLTADLSPAILHRSGLAAALKWLGRWYEDRFALKVTIEAEVDPDLDEETRVTLFRSVRELLFNIVKHAHVTGARVQLEMEADGRVRIVVSDEGVGFDPDAVRAREGTAGSFGLFSLRERLELLGGRLGVDSAPGRGASLMIIGPPPRETPPEASAASAAAAEPSEVPVRKRTAGRRRPVRGKKR